MRNTHTKNIGDSLFYVFDTTMQWINEAFKTSPNDFIQIETVEDDYTVIMKDGTLVSALAIDGSSKVISEDEFEEILESADSKLMAYMNDGCHYVSFYFLRDKDGVREDLEKTYGLAHYTADRIGLDIHDIIDEQIDVLTEYCQKERCLMLFWTNMSGLSKEEKKIAQRLKIQERKGLPLATDAQNLGMGVSTIITRHHSFVDEFKEDLKNMNIASRKLKAVDFLKEVREGIDKDFTGEDWEPSLPGDKIPGRLTMDNSMDLSGCVWPRLDKQLFPRSAELVDHTTVKIGETLYAPITIELMPKKPTAFQALFRRLKKEGIPWRMHMLVKNDGLGLLGWKEALASIITWSPGAPENKRLVELKKKLTQLREEGDEIVSLQIALCTWGPADNKLEVDRRKAILARCVQGWGVCDVAEACGDPLETSMSSLPGVCVGSIATPTPEPLYEAIKMAPITRPASAWVSGSQPLRTLDGKLMPYQPYSKLQTSWVSLIFAPMGFGKSVFMNYCNLSLILSPELDELPFISIIDVGPSSKGLISLIRNGLPKEKKHLAMYERLTNTERHSINVFDTPLGLRYPLASHSAFLINFLSYLAIQDDKDLPTDGVDGISKQLVKFAYDKMCDPTSARAYRKNILPKIDEILNKLNFTVDPGKTKWWDVVDFLYTKDLIHEATLAQRYAVPNLKDIAALCKDKRIESIYGKVTVGGSEDMPSFVWRKMNEALNKYALLGNPTQFDLGEARIVSLDLDEVARGGGPDSKRRIGLMYMVAYYVLTKTFFFGKDSLIEMAPSVGNYNIDYREYHKKIADSVAKLPKRFCIDEKHRIKGLTNIENQLDTSILEGRKWKVEIMQATQLADDFSEKSRELATNIFILGAGNKSNIEKVREQFGLSNTMVYHLANSMRKPNKEGSTLLALLETERGTFEQLLASTQGPTFLWATNSSRDDSYVRDTIAAEIGDTEARMLLVKHYPSGSLDAEIEDRKKQMGIDARKADYQEESYSQAEQDEDDDMPTGILTDIIKELLAAYEAEKQAANEPQLLAASA